MWLTPPAYLEFGNEADNIKQYEKEKFNSIGTNPKIQIPFRIIINSEQHGGVSLCVSETPQIRYANIPILPLKNGSNIVHSAEPLKQKTPYGVFCLY